jgi:hypothetical protein
MNRRYIFRLIALSIATVLGVWFLADVSVLAWIYFQFGGHLPLFVRRQDLINTAVLGVGLASSLTVYLRLARQKRSTG